MKIQFPQLPVIIVTGTGSEEVAVNAMKPGASDYMIKTHIHIQRLPHTIAAVLALKQVESERIQAEIELKKRMNLIEQSNDMMVGRELKMIELKKEVNTLLERLGEPKKYEVR